MAQIILKVALDKSSIASARAEAEKAVQGVSESFRAAGQQSRGVYSIEKQFSNLSNTIKNMKALYPAGVFDELSESITKNIETSKKLVKSFEANGKLAKDEKKTLAGLKGEYQKLSASMSVLRNETEKLDKDNKQQGINVDQLRKRLANLANTVQNASKYYKKGTFDKVTQGIKEQQTALKSITPESENYAETVKSVDKAVNTLSADFAEAKQNSDNLHDSITEITAGFLKFQLAAILVMKPLQLIRNAFKSINETLVNTENAVISLQRVLPSGSASDEDIADRLYKLAQRYGQTFDNVSEIATNFARAGMSWNDTIKATESALLALNVAELDATEASDGLLSVMNQFKLSASELTNVVDILNKTADNFPVTTEKLLTALQRTGSSARNANLNLEETVGLVTAISKATNRSGENIGTALNALITQGTKSSNLDTFASLSEGTNTAVQNYRNGVGNILDIWTEVSKVIKEANGSQAEILNKLASSEDLTSLSNDLQNELGDIYDTSTKIYDTASAYRKNYFIALLENIDTVQDAIAGTQNAIGYSQKENEKYLDTYTAKVNKLKAQWQALANDKQGWLKFKKGLVDVGSALLTATKYTGGLRTIVIALSTITWALVGTKLIAGIKAIGVAIKSLTTSALSLNSVLGVIGLAATAISMIWGGIEQGVDDARRKAKAARQEAIDTWQNEKEEAQGLVELYSRYSELADITNRTANEQKEFLSVQKSLTEQIGYQAYQLKGLDENSKEYLETLQKITQEELRQKVMDSQAAYNATVKETNGGSVDLGKHGFNPFDGDPKVIKDLNKLYNTKILVSGTPFERIIGTDRYKLASKGSAIEDAIFYSDVANYLYNNGYGEKSEFTNVQQGASKARQEAEQVISAYLEKTLLSAYFKDGFDATNNRIDEIIEQAKSELGLNVQDIYKNTGVLAVGDRAEDTGFNSLIEFLESYAREFSGVAKSTSNVTSKTKDWAEAAKEVIDNYDGILSRLKEIRDTQEQINALEEKKKALEDAMTQQTVRVYNATTGQWEWQANERNIQSAREALEKEAYNAIENKLESGNATGEDIYNTLLDLKDLIPDTARAIASVFREEGYNIPEFDRGGILNGLGGIKATSRPETVLDPSITSKILEPTSNEQFTNFAKSMRLLFGASRDLATTKVVSNYGGNTDNSDNRTITVNGVPITREMADSLTVTELFAQAAFLKD